MKLVRHIACLGFAVLLAPSARAQEFWDKKPYTEWSKGECDKLLKDSPWTRHTGTRNVERSAAFSKTPQDDTISSGAGAGSEQRIDYYAQIRSATPVRMAVIRRAQIENKYDKLSADQKKLFDQSAEAFLAANYKDRIVVHVEYASNVETFARALERYWQTIQLPELQLKTYLITAAGKRIQPIEYKTGPPGSFEFELIFPREANGEPIVSPNDDSFKIEFPYPSFDDLTGNRTEAAQRASLTAERGFVEFKIGKMKFKGQTVY